MKQSFGDIVLVGGLNELNVQLTPVPIANLSGIITDRLDGSKIAGAKVTLGDLVTYTDINGVYSLYGLAPGSYNGLVEKEHYYPLGFTANLVSGDNRLDFAIDPILLTSVVMGMRTKGDGDCTDTPDSRFVSQFVFSTLIGDKVANTTFYTDYTLTLPANPSTKQTWRETDLEKYTFGFFLMGPMIATGGVRCTQFWVVAIYPDGSSRILRPYEGPSWEKVDDVIPDEDASYVRFTNSGAMYPYGGAYYRYKVG